MKLAETVTFGGSGLNRAAEHRRQPVQIAALWQSGRVLLMWRGRPLVAEGALAFLPTAHTLGGQVDTALFLGMNTTAVGDHAVFAQDISAWVPVEPVAQQAGLFDTSVQAHPELPPEQAFHELRAVMVQLTPRDAELAATARALLEWHRSHGFCASCGAKSDMVHGGWQRSCSACNAQHFPRTDPVVIMLITRGNQVLLGRGPTWPEGMYSLLAGFVEPGETIEAAVRREVLEESGILVGAVGYLASQPWPFPASLMIGCQGEALSEAITVDPEELQDARWVSREDLVDAFAGLHPLIKPSRKGAIARFLLDHWLADRLA
jgi:NAD+ diphosphatase